VRSSSQVRRLTGIDVFAVVPRVARKRGQLSLYEALDEPASAFAQSMRALRTLVLSSSSGSRPVSVGFVSCNPREGRSSIAANIAYLIASSGQPVTLLDADLRNPALTKALAPVDVPNLRELAALARGDATSLRLTVNSTLSFTPAMSVGSEYDPNLLFCSRETLQGISRLMAAGEVIVDLPPLSCSADPIAVGKALTGVIVVAALYQTTLDDLADAVRTLNRIGVRILGVILNEVPRDDGIGIWRPQST
jgi:polysaccharide biosynthesis transport protein